MTLNSSVIVQTLLNPAVVAVLSIFLNTMFASNHMYPENPEGTQVIVGCMNMGYDIYQTLPGIELTTCSVPSARRFH